MSEAPRSMGARAWAALGVVYVVWGSTYLAIRYAVETIPPMLGAGVRFLAAGAISLLAVRLVRGPSALRATRTQLVTAAAAGVLMLVAGNGLVNVAEQHIPSGLAALLVACVPLWLVILRALLRDRAAPVTLVGVLLGLAGVAVLVRPGGDSGGGSGYAALLVLASLSWATGSLLTVRRPVPADPFLGTSVQMLVAGAVLVVAGAARGELHGFSLAQVSGTSLLALAYLVVFGSIVAFTAYVWVLGVAPVSVVSTYAYVNPAVAVLLGAVVAGEHLTVTEAVGGLVILCAVVVVVTAESARKRRAARQRERERAAAEVVT